MVAKKEWQKWNTKWQLLTVGVLFYLWVVAEEKRTEKVGELFCCSSNRVTSERIKMPARRMDGGYINEGIVSFQIITYQPGVRTQTEHRLHIFIN